MNKSTRLLLFSTISILFMTTAALSQVCTVGEQQACFCPDNTTSIQYCRPDRNGWERCDCTVYTIWNDPATSLSWQDPQKDAFTDNDTGLPQLDAVRYCGEVVMGGYDDWRLPDIDELRTLIRGNPDTMTGGACPVQDGSPKSDMYETACLPTVDYGGPGVDGCYWVPELTGRCDKPDPADEGVRPLEFVSSTVASDDEFWVGCVLFNEASVVFNHIYSLADVRCVRNGPTTAPACEPGPPEACIPGETRQCPAANGKDGAQSCADDGACWGPCESTEFTPSPPITDICDQCDQVVLTLTVPAPLQNEMRMLLAFLYKSEAFTVPPGGPPDGGTDYNQLLNPVIDFGTPLVMTVPACSYYRDRCIPEGDYNLWVSLLQSDQWPPWPVEGDFIWGQGEAPFSLQTGVHQEINLDLELVPWVEPPTAITLSDFSARARCKKVELTWTTEAEIDNAGFNLYRSGAGSGEYVKINPDIIPAAGSPARGAVYAFTDPGVNNGETYYYKLEDIDVSGTATMHGPESATPRLLYWLLK